MGIAAIIVLAAASFALYYAYMHIDEISSFTDPTEDVTLDNDSSRGNSSDSQDSNNFQGAKLQGRKGVNPHRHNHKKPNKV